MSASFVPLVGPDFEAALACHDDPSGVVLASYATSGLQASAFADAAALVTTMVARRSPPPSLSGGAASSLQAAPQQAPLFLSYTSNLISSGLRESFAALAAAGLLDGVVTSAGGVEEDLIKCLGPTVCGDFALKGETLRRSGLNRVGNLLVPNDNYVAFETFVLPVFAAVHATQRRSGLAEGTAPSDVVAALAGAMRDRLAAAASAPTATAESAAAARAAAEGSLLVQCLARGVPVFCPALTDGSIGDMMFFYNVKNPGMLVDPAVDEERLRALFRHRSGGGGGAIARQIGLVCLGGGMPRHHLLRAAAGARPRRAVAAWDALLVGAASEADGTVSAGCLRDDRSQGLHFPAPRTGLSSSDDGSDASDGEALSGGGGEATGRCEANVIRLPMEATLVFPLLAARMLRAAPVASRVGNAEV